ncbi:ArsR family transcriptional regulator [Arthrobacter sp. SF27]|nr:helix-turn-helix domain-containing protein [Arthrobacter sp. SF27]NMR28233.1 ArsR family transcriptional regulator [Arthrobacter sp. SF27]
MSSARAALLQRLRDQPEACTVEKLSTDTGQHQNTIREHLEALVEAGLARRMTAARGSRGRPARLYQAVPEESQATAYAALATILASHIANSSTQPRAEGISVGELWARQLERDGPPSGTDHPMDGTDGLSARRRTVALLESVGFGVDVDASWSAVRLTRCPLLQAARQTPHVVCSVHLGMVRGLLAQLGEDPDQAQLIPFAEPGACILRLGHPRQGPEEMDQQADPTGPSSKPVRRTGHTGA